MTAIAPARFTPLAGDVTLPRVVRSEWTKFWSLRSTWWSLMSVVAISLGLGLAASIDAAHSHSGTTSARDIAVTSQFGLLFAQLAAVTLGALLVTSEYGTGMIRATMTAVPRRTTALLAKASVLVAVLFPLMAATSIGSLLLANVAWQSQGVDAASLGDDGVLPVVLGTPLYLSAAALFALALGTIVRNSAATISALTALFFVIPAVAGLARFLEKLAPALPPNAGGALSGQTLTSEPLSGWIGFALFCAYTVILVGVAALRLRRSDV